MAVAVWRALPHRLTAGDGGWWGAHVLGDEVHMHAAPDIE